MNPKRRFDIFCFKHRNKGIPNLMLYISIGAGIVYLLSLFNGGNVLYDLLCFDKAKILQGQVWRLVSHVFTYTLGRNPILTVISLLCYISLGRAVENVWGTLRFNLYYLTTLVIMDAFAMIFCPAGSILEIYYAARMPYYLNLTLLITYATFYPDARFMVAFFIPVKAWFLSLLYIVLNVIEIFNMVYPVLIFPHCLFPLMGFSGYILFVGKNAINLLPVSWRIHLRRMFRKRPAAKKTGTIQFRTGDYQVDNTSVRAPYTHRCTVCGKTDISNPELEFRYCSRCQGYHCYCQEHISNHAHIE